MLIKIQPDATVCRYLFTAKSLYMFRVSQHPSSGVLKTVTATSGTGHNTGTATSLQRGLIGTGLCESRHWPVCIYDNISLNPSWNEEYFRQKVYRNSKHTFCVQKLFFENPAVYEIMWGKNMVEPDRSQMIIWRMRVACWIPNATNTHTQIM